jgi:hypothetical protein
LVFFGHWVYFAVIWNILTRFGILFPEKSGKPALLDKERTENFSGARSILSTP